MIRRHPILTVLLTCLLVAVVSYGWVSRPMPDFGRKVLIYSSAEASEDSRVAAGIKQIESLMRDVRFNVEISHERAVFTDKTLSGYQAVVFLNTSGKDLEPEQQVAFERYIQAGGGYVGINAAAEAKQGVNEWFWYQRLVGASRASSPNGAEGTRLVKKNEPHQSLVAALPDQWQVTDKWYDYRRVSSGLRVLLTATSESEQERAGERETPVAWYRQFDGGRSFYLGLGHEESLYDETWFKQLLNSGITYAMGNGSSLDYSRSRPEAWRFTRSVLDSNLNEPIKIAFSPEGELYYIQRGGELLRYDFEQATSVLVHHFDVRTFGEYGLLGLAFDPEFIENRWLYIYRTIAHEGAGRHVLSRYKFIDGRVDESTEQQLLAMNADGNDKHATAHTGGDMLFDDSGNLWLATGDDTRAGEASYIDDRPGHIGSDAARSAGNSQDLRGKILRIKPRADRNKNGRYYEIPEGNLFESADEGRPEIYVMGLRNPYTLSYDHRRNRIYWGEVGPDASEPNSRGPRGFDEVNFAEKPGNYGWPFVIADNQPYNYYDYEQQQALGKADVSGPKNPSRNNTGLTVLPPAQPAWIYYPYSESETFFELGSGGRNALVIPIYYSDETSQDSEVKFPSYFDGKLLISDFIRRWLMVVNTDETGRPETIAPVFNQSFSAPLDMAYGPDGALYVVEYGTDWFSQNPDAYISRIEYYSGDNAPPVAVATASKSIGAAPLVTELDASGSYDRGAGDSRLSYRWQLIHNGKPGEIIGEKAVQSHTFKNTGEQFVLLTVTDEGGQESTQRLRFQVGNERPEVELELNGNRSFYWEDQPLEYQVSVSDLEDGSTGSGELRGEDIVVRQGYVAGGEDLATVLSKHSVDPVLAGSELVKGGSDCHACHSLETPSIGPSWQAISDRYKDRSDAASYLEDVIANGGSGQWDGNHAMPGHPGLTAEQLNHISRYILSLSAAGADDQQSSLAGVLHFDKHQNDYIDVKESGLLTLDMGRFYPGAYLLSARYTDKGTATAPALQGQDTVVLRFPRFSAAAFDTLVSMRGFGVGNEKVGFITKPWKGSPRSYGVLKGIDLSGISRIRVTTWAQKPVMPGGILQLRLDDPESKAVASGVVESALLADAKGKAVELDVSRVEGVHDLYLGTWLAPDRSEEPEVHQALYGIMSMEFLR